MGRARALYIFIFENLLSKVGIKLLFRIPSIWENCAGFCWISFSFPKEISQPRYLKLFTCYKHLLSTVVLYLTVSFPKNATVSDFSGNISVRNRKRFVQILHWQKLWLVLFLLHFAKKLILSTSLKARSDFAPSYALLSPPLTQAQDVLILQDLSRFSCAGRG